ncbi:patr class I histocompatibility antigen, A-126 alpha chain-like [Mesocricetus auratus]|uniref:Patr class I histocompatibility antigen, A-126 alpha chain-like n=1 Tax=Mesocricetus auratus TaxID=10036 RepID=A0ABM2WDT1_MESAU|nr:patr class I histocompatibility antigen, A-126 alpha chain-like [Mesocricetus auratus]XP_040596813.1 patr class I histocompatibility antigen, A-126 alpha chain-like [Mesocricetus auratus]
MASGLDSKGYFDQYEVDNDQGSHSLSYLQTLLTWHDLEPDFILGVYLDDILIERFNSRAEARRLEHCAPWVDQQQPEYWDSETRAIRKLIDIYQDFLETVLHLYNQSETGYHTMQMLIACDVLPEEKFSRAQFKFVFDGRDYITLNEDLSTWTVVGKESEILREEWEKATFPKLFISTVMKSCENVILHQLDYGKDFFLRRDILKLHVTHKVRADGNVTLRCWALNFYHAELTLTWQRDGNNQIQNVEVIETRPAGDGTFQKWAAVVVSPGEEQRYTCHVDHEGLREPITLRWEPPQPSLPIMPIVTGLGLGVVLTGAVVTFLIWKRRSKGKKRAGSEFMSPWEYQA